MYKDYFLNPSAMKQEKRNLRGKNYSTVLLDVSLLFLRWIRKNVSDLTLAEDAESFLTLPNVWKAGLLGKLTITIGLQSKFLTYKKVLKDCAGMVTLFRL
ncbi:MAG: hypothetical protein ACLU6Y_09335 [Ruminococcus sp.]